MVCQYSRVGRLSSEKHEGIPSMGVERRGGVTLTVGNRTTVMGGYDTWPARLAASSLRAKFKKSLELRTLWRLYSYDTLLEGLAQHLQDVAPELRPFVQEKHPVVRQRHLAGHRHLAPPISPTAEIVWCGARQGRVVTHAVRSPVRPATRWMRVVSRASGRVMAGRMVVSRCASIDLPAPGGPKSRTLWSERLHDLQLYQNLSGCRRVLR
jgi:hypothetical protein